MKVLAPLFFSLSFDRFEQESSGSTDHWSFVIVINWLALETITEKNLFTLFRSTQNPSTRVHGDLRAAIGGQVRLDLLLSSHSLSEGFQTGMVLESIQRTCEIIQEIEYSNVSHSQTLAHKIILLKQLVKQFTPFVEGLHQLRAITSFLEGEKGVSRWTGRGSVMSLQISQRRK